MGLGLIYKQKFSVLRGLLRVSGFASRSSGFVSLQFLLAATRNALCLATLAFSFLSLPFAQADSLVASALDGIRSESYFPVDAVDKRVDESCDQDSLGAIDDEGLSKSIVGSEELLSIMQKSTAEKVVSAAVEVVDVRKITPHKEIYAANSVKYALPLWLDRFKAHKLSTSVLILADPLYELQAQALIHQALMDRPKTSDDGALEFPPISVVAGGMSAWVAAALPVQGPPSLRRKLHELPPVYFINNHMPGNDVIVASSEVEQEALSNLLQEKIFLLEPEGVKNFVSRLAAFKLQHPEYKNLILIGNGYSSRHQLAYASQPLGQVYFVEEGYSGFERMLEVSQRASLSRQNPLRVGRCDA